MLSERVTVKSMGTMKGRGVIAKKDLAAGEFVGVLAGRVVPDARHIALVHNGILTGRFAMETRDKSGRLYVVEPENPKDRQADKRFDSSCGHFINEPAPGERLNVTWSHNKAYDPERIDCYTARPIKAGKELLVHYGNAYQRKYRKPHQHPLASHVNPVVDSRLARMRSLVKDMRVLRSR